MHPLDDVRRLALRDGRTLGYAEYGDPDGFPLFHCHGHPGSRLEGLYLHEKARQAAVRVIAADRPGYGESSRKPGRTILDWADDVLEAADTLGFQAFAVMGGSGGAPFALGTAYRLPQRVSVAGVVSGIGPLNARGATEGMRPLNRLAFKYASRIPFLPDLIMKSMANKMRRDPDGTITRLRNAMAPVDREIIDREDLAEELKAIVLEAFRQGSKASADEVRLLGRPWGFRLEDVRTKVHLWQGTADHLVPQSMGRYMAGVLPNCEAHFVEGEGHLLFVQRTAEILGAMKPAA